MLHRFLQSKMDPPGDLSNTMGDFFTKNVDLKQHKDDFTSKKGWI